MLSKILHVKKILPVYGCLVCVYVCALHVASSHGVWKRVQILLRLEFHMVLSYYVSAGN